MTIMEHNIKSLEEEEIWAKTDCSLNFRRKIWDNNLHLRGRDRKSKLKLCHRPGLGAQKVEKRTIA